MYSFSETLVEKRVFENEELKVQKRTKTQTVLDDGDNEIVNEPVVTVQDVTDDGMVENEFEKFKELDAKNESNDVDDLEFLATLEKDDLVAKSLMNSNKFDEDEEDTILNALNEGNGVDESINTIFDEDEALIKLKQESLQIAPNDLSTEDLNKTISPVEALVHDVDEFIERMERSLSEDGGEVVESPVDADNETLKEETVGPEEEDDEVEYQLLEKYLQEIQQKGVSSFIETISSSGVSAVEVLRLFDLHLSEQVEEKVMWGILSNYLRRHVYRRERLASVNTIEDVVNLIQQSKKIVVLTGAGISVSCGIPDFRSANGIYAKVKETFSLPCPEAMFDIEFFRDDPSAFYSFAHELYPGQHIPSPSHYFIRMLETKEKLLRNYTQNIDSLEQVAGIERLIQCHGSFKTVSCIDCKAKKDGKTIEKDVLSHSIPFCENCGGILKPDIVFFGEPLSKEFEQSIHLDREQVDLLIVMGSSLKVQPVSNVLDYIPPKVPQIYINREPCLHHTFDVELLGSSDEIVSIICKELGWSLENEFNEIDKITENISTFQRIPPHRYLFQHALVNPVLLERWQSGNEQPTDVSDDEGEEILFSDHESDEGNEKIEQKMEEGDEETENLCGQLDVQDLLAQESQVETI